VVVADALASLAADRLLARLADVGATRPRGTQREAGLSS
jgi:hypothetical protein